MKAITLLSSGLDSVAALAIAAETLDLEVAITFDYGQKAWKKEIEFSRKVCEYFELEHKAIKLDWLSEITFTSLVNKELEIPFLCAEDIDEAAPPEITEASAKAVWVPNRNGVMLNIAGSFAESQECEYIVVGFNGEEAGTFPDNSLDYVKAVDNAFLYSTQNKVKVLAPLIEFNKTQIVDRALKAKAPLEYSWSCYYGEELPCGKCESCLRRARAFKNLRTKDPLLERLLKENRIS